MKYTLALVSIALFIASVFFTRQVLVHSDQNQTHKSNDAELNHVKYGIFSVDAWKDQLLAAAKSEFEKIYSSKETEEEMKDHISTIMTKMIDEVVARVKSENEKTTSGKVKQLFIDMFVDIENLKKGVPQYTDAVILELKKPKTKDQVKSAVVGQLEEFAARSTDVKNQTRLQNIIHATGSEDLASAREKTKANILKAQNAVENESAALILLTLGSVFLFVISGERRSPVQFLALIGSLTLLLWAGAATPMIDIEAKISELKFLLIGHPIVFENQVFYFQSKSILDVFLIMIKDPKFQMKAVGLLVVTFSLVFPVVKLISSMLYYFNLKNLKNSRLVQFFVLKSGKWSMADVMVIAIFMSYIGFNGVIESQLADLRGAHGDGMNVITTNGTSLQPGFYSFLSFVLIAMLLSQVLSKDEHPSK